MNEVKEIIRRFILTTYLPGEALEDLRDDTPLQTSGLLDSLATQGLVNFLQQRFGVELDVYETMVERFDRIEEIAATVVQKQASIQPMEVR